MIRFATFMDRQAGRLAAFGRDRRGASAIEFAIVSMPFIMLLLGILQIGIFYMTQSALDAGLLKTSSALRGDFTPGTSFVQKTHTQLKNLVVSYSGGLINNGSLSVELVQMSSLTGAAVPIADVSADYGTSTSTLVLRAETRPMTFAPGLSTLAVVRSAVILRRQGT